MIGSLSNFGEALVFDSVFGRSSSYNWPGTLHFALFTNIPDDAGANGTEVSTSGTGYARRAVSNNTTNFPLTPTSGLSKGIKSNATVINFPTALADWGEVKGGGVYDAATGGNLLWLWEWATPRNVASGDTMKVEVNELQFTFNAVDALNADCLLSFALQRAFLDAFFGNPSAPAIPTELYGALMTTIPGADETVTAGAELTGNNYARALVPNDLVRWPATVNGAKSNAQQIVWPVATPAGWNSVVGVAFYSASSGGSLIAKMKLDSTQSWQPGDQARIPANGMPIVAD
jgi:hypothetical protein